MAATRLLMRRLRDILRLKYEAGLTHRASAQACTVGLGTVSSYLTRATAAGLTWPLPDALDDAALEKLDAAAQAMCNPIDDKRGTIEFRTKVAGVLARRTAKIAYDRAQART